MKQTESEFDIESKKAIFELKKLEGGQLRVHHKGGRVKGRASKLFNLNPLQLARAIAWGDYEDVINRVGFPWEDRYFDAVTSINGQSFPRHPSERWEIGEPLKSWIAEMLDAKEYKYVHRLTDFLKSYRDSEGVVDEVRTALLTAWVSCNMRSGAVGWFCLKNSQTEKHKRGVLDAIRETEQNIEQGTREGKTRDAKLEWHLRTYIDGARVVAYKFQHFESTTRESFFKHDNKTKYVKYAEVIKLAQYYKGGAEKKNFDHLCKLLREMGLPKGKATLAV